MYAFSHRNARVSNSKPRFQKWSGGRDRFEADHPSQYSQVRIEFAKDLEWQRSSAVLPLQETRAIPQELTVVTAEIFDYFVTESQTKSVDQLLEIFRNFFISHNPEAVPGIFQKAFYDILVGHHTQGALTLINRCAFTVVNVCLKGKGLAYIDQLVLDLEARSPLPSDACLAARQFRDWVEAYCESEEYQLLKLFSPQSRKQSPSWGDRYLRFALLAQALNLGVAPEQRRACQMLYRVIHHRYKFQLAMFLAKGCEGTAGEKGVVNPTLIPPTTLKLIHKLMVGRGEGYARLAQMFLQGTAKETYGDFKGALGEHLLLSVAGDRRLKWLPRKLNQYLSGLSPEKNPIKVGQHLITKTCNQLIDYLLNPAHVQNPTHPFLLMMIEQEFLSLSVLLLKLVLISPHSYKILMLALNNLISYFKAHPEQECGWLKGFMETLQVVFTLGLDEGQYCPIEPGI